MSPARTIYDVAWLEAAVRRVSGRVMRLRGWRIEGELPDAPRFVLLAAPHTSVLDLPLMLAVALHFRVRLHWLGLASYFRWPVAGLLRRLGGIPISRGPAAARVRAAADVMATHDRIAVAISPEGARRRVPRWRTGFYHLAVQSGVPVVLGFLDYQHKMAGVGPALMPTGDLEADLDAVRAFYTGMQGRHPHQQGPIAVTPDASLP